MKRFFMVCMALLFAGSAFAQEVKQEEKKGPEFNFSAKGWVYGISGSQSDYAYDYSHIRVRPLFSISNDNIKLVTQLEIDQDFGREADPTKYGVGHPGADPGVDNQVVEVKNAYIEAKNVIVPGLSLMAGLNGYKFPIVVDNDFAVYQAGYDFGMGKALVSYIKVNEYDVVEEKADKTKQNQDVQAYALDLPIKFDKLTIRPGVIMIKGSKDYVDAATTPFAKASLINYALNANADFGMVAFTATGAMMKGTLSDDGTTEVKNSSMGFDLGVDVKPADGIKIGLFCTYGSGNDGKKATENDSYFNTLNNLFGSQKSATVTGGVSSNGSAGAPDGRLFLLENASIASVGGVNYFDSMDNALGYISYGLSAEGKFDKLVIFAQFGVASTVEKNSAGDKKIGSEIDAKVSYEIGPKTVIFGEYAYLMAGDDMGLGAYATAEKASQFAFGMTTQM